MAGEQAAAIAGAESVADAVRRVADASVAAAKGAALPGTVGDFLIEGAPNGSFVIRGEGLGTSGTVTFGGHPAKTNGWGSQRIEGTVPAAFKSGEVVVHIDANTRKRAPFKL